jgi:putative ABC transport system permease protein
VVLWHYPTLLVALVGAVLLLVVAASSYPLFISASSSEAVAQEIERTIGGRYGSGIQLRVVDPPSTYEDKREAFRVATSDIAHIEGPIETILGPGVSIANPDRVTRPLFARIAARTGALEHVSVVAGVGEEDDGAWIADHLARHLRLEPGDFVEISAEDITTKVRIAGIYGALFNEPRAPYWSALYPDIYPSGDSAPPPSFLLVDHEKFIELAARTNTENVKFIFEAPVAPGTTLQGFSETRNGVRGFEQLLSVRNELTKIFGCRFCFSRFHYTSSIHSVEAKAQRRVSIAEGPVELLLGAGVLVGLGVVAAAAAFGNAARSVESSLLFARGLEPRTVAGKTVAEALIPAVVGSVAGLGVAVAVVLWLGPSGTIDSSAYVSAVIRAVAAVPVALILLALVAAVAFARQSESTSARIRILGRIPWELVLAIGGLYLFQNILQGHAFGDPDQTGVAQPSLYLLLFPVLAIGGFSGLIADGAIVGLRGLRERSERLPESLYLFVHRLADAGRFAVLLFTAFALALGVFVYSQTMTSSLEKTVEAKSKIFVGSDVQVLVDEDRVLPNDFPYTATKITRLPSALTLAGGAPVDVLAIHDEAFADAAYWNSQLGAASLQGLIDKLQTDSSSLPVVLAGNLPSNPRLSVRDSPLSIDPVAQVEAFPGTSAHPLVVALEPRLRRAIEPLPTDLFALAGTTTEYWIKGETRGITRALARLDPPLTFFTSAEQVRDVPSIAVVIDMLAVQRSLGLATGLLVIVITLTYLQMRQRRRVISYALARRMGLSSGAHRRTLVAEIGGVLAVSFVAGAILALLIAYLVVDEIDPLSTIPPGPIFAPPTPMIVGATAVLLVLSLVSGALTNRRAERTDVAEVMRLAT